MIGYISMKNILQGGRIAKIFAWTKTHIKTTLLIIIIVCGSVYGVYRSFSPTETANQYSIGTVTQGSIVTTISGTGQVSASNEVAVTAKTSGDITALYIVAGQEVKAGALLASIDATDASYELETAKLSYDELVTIDADDLTDAQNEYRDTKRDLSESYVQAQATLTKVSTDLSDVLAGIDDLRNGYLSTSKTGLTATEREYINRSLKSYYSSQDAVQTFVKTYRTVSNTVSEVETEKLLADAQKIAAEVAITTKYAQDAVVYLRNQEETPSSLGTAAYTVVTGLVSDAHAIVSDLTTARNTITQAQRSFETAERNLADLQEGPTELELRSEALALRQKQNSYNDHFIRAPFDGIIAAVEAKKGENINSGGTVATLITKQKIAEISLNEIDAAQIVIGQKVTVGFDALEDVIVHGTVSEIDLIGTVSQGVVNYGVTIVFTSDDARIKPGMTTSAEIIISEKENILTVPVSAVKTVQGKRYVEVPTRPVSARQVASADITTTQVPVETGVSNDTTIEIVSGLAVGDQIITRTTTTATATTQTGSLFGGSTRTSGGGSMRAVTR